MGPRPDLIAARLSVPGSPDLEAVSLWWLPCWFPELTSDARSGAGMGHPRSPLRGAYGWHGPQREPVGAAAVISGTRTPNSCACPHAAHRSILLTPGVRRNLIVTIADAGEGGWPCFAPCVPPRLAPR